MRAVEKARLASGAGDGGVGGCIDDDLQAVRGGRGDDQGQVEHRYEHRRGALGVLAHRWHWLAAVLRATATKRRPTSLLRRSRSALLHQLSFPLCSRFLALWSSRESVDGGPAKNPTVEPRADVLQRCSLASEPRRYGSRVQMRHTSTVHRRPKHREGADQGRGAAV